MKKIALLPTLGRFVHSALLDDWFLKFICLGLAVLMWFYVDGELTDQSDIVVTLRKSDLQLPVGWELAADQPLPKFFVRLRGPRRTMQYVTAERLTFKRKIPIATPKSGRNPIRIEPEDLQAEPFEVLSVTPRDGEAVVGLYSSGPDSETRFMKFEIRPMPLQGMAMRFEPPKVEVQVTASPRDFENPEVASRVRLFVEWPSQWQKAESGMVLGPLEVPVQYFSPPEFQVSGLNGGSMPMVKVTGTVADSKPAEPPPAVPPAPPPVPPTKGNPPNAAP